MPIPLTPHLSIPDDAVSIRCIRASGPGGQHVNKVASAVQLRFDPSRCTFSESALIRLQRLAGRRWTDSGEIVITAQRFRTQEANKHDAYARLAALVRQALIEPKLRRATQPTRAAHERRLQTKKRRGSIKNTRARVKADD